MASCPACGSSRVRNDYKPAPLALRIFFIRALLCDHCNYQFRIFSISATSARDPQQRSNTRPAVFNPPLTREVDLTKLIGVATPPESNEGQNPQRSQTQTDLRNEIALSHANEAGSQTHSEVNDQEQSSQSFNITCPNCGSASVKRRRRNTMERIAFSIGDHKAFTCSSCEGTFYS